MPKVLLVNGPYLDQKSNKKIEIYGNICLSEIEKKVSSIFSRRCISSETFHSNSENEIVRWLKKKVKQTFYY